MYICDFETTTRKYNEKKSWVWLWGIKGTMESDEMVWGLSMKTFFDYVRDKELDDLFFHNLSFDGNYIFQWMLSNGFKFYNSLFDEEEKPLLRNHFKWIMDDKKNIYTMTINYDGHLFTLGCSYKILMASVEKLGDSIGEVKLSMDYDVIYNKESEVPKKVIDYLERDIDVVIKTFTKFISLIDQKTTVAGMAYNDFMNYYGRTKFTKDFGGWVKGMFGKTYYSNVLSKDEWLKVSKSYHGGYTNWNRKYTNKPIKVKNGISYDVNSLYPSVMLYNKMPYGRYSNEKPKGSSCCIYIVQITSAVSKNINAPALFKELKGGVKAKYMHEIFNEDRVMWQEELDFIKKHYVINYKIIETLYFKKKIVFKEWIIERQDKKIKAKTNVERNCWKLVLNSLYGKFGQKFKLGSSIIEEDGKKPGDFRKGTIRYGKEKQYKLSIAVKECGELKHIAVSSYIAMKSRLVLWKSIFDNLDIWLYSDTDSCYFSDEPKGIKIDDNKFGSWKPEHKFDMFKVLRSKCYIYNCLSEYKNGEWKDVNALNKVVSGISKTGREQINWDNFYIGSIIPEGKRSSVSVDGGKHIVDTDYKLGTLPGEREDKNGKNI